MSDTAPTTEDRQQLCAALVLSSAEDGPRKLGVFTDEELTALDGLELAQVVPMPWILDHEGVLEARAAASVALRGLIARRMVLPAELLAEDWDDLGDDPRRLYAIDPLQGILTLRRSFEALLSYQRMVAEQVHTVVQYVYGQSAVLEEEITADGYHHFSVLPLETAAEHALTLIDQDGVAGSDGAPVALRMSEVQGHELLDPILSDTRALTVGSLVTRDGDAEQLTFYATSDRLVVSRSEQDPTGQEVQEDPLLEFAEASADSVREIARTLLVATQDA